MKESNPDYLIIDGSNLLYRAFYANTSNDVSAVAGLAHHGALMTINKYFKKYTPNEKIVVCFDRSNWRKSYTKSKQCISGKLYKGNRRREQSTKQKKKYEAFVEHITEFEEILRNHTSIVVTAADNLEADDLISGMVQLASLKNQSSIIISGDKDMMQLLRFSDTQIIDPATGKNRTLDDWGGNADWFMFEKCIRGDLGDNVQSSLPRCRKTRIDKAFIDEFEKQNLMKETWNHPDGRTLSVEKLFNEGKLLMDLTCQPDDIQSLIFTTILKDINNPGIFSYFEFLKFLGKYQMNRISDSIEQFLPLLSK